MKENTRIGILTLYYRNYNFGGLLQAFALQYYLESCGYSSEQITFDSQIDNITFLKRNIRNRTGISKIKAILRFYEFLIKKHINIILHKKAEKGIRNRINKFLQFQQKIPHSNMVVTKETIAKILPYYDIFICGSDVIWNAGIDPYISCLGFVENKYKFAYAASLGRATIPENWFEKNEKYLKKLNNISVREESVKKELQKLLYDRNIKCVADPTFLLTAEEWKKVINVRDVNTSKDIVCYLLGSSKNQRKSIMNSASSLNYSVYTFPYIENIYRSIDTRFGDTRDFESGPIEFLRVLAEAKIVITDSFHAVVFSLLFHKNFWAIKRYNGEMDSGMNGRVQNLLKEVGLECRLIENEQIEKIDLLQQVDFSHSDSIIKNMREYSCSYIYDNLRNAKEKGDKIVI